jgi:hypothetical protein
VPPGAFLAYANSTRLPQVFISEIGEVSKIASNISTAKEGGAELGGFIAKLSGKVSDARNLGRVHDRGINRNGATCANSRGSARTIGNRSLCFPKGR